MRFLLSILLIVSCAGPVGPQIDYSPMYGQWYSPDGQVRLTLHEDGRYVWSEKYGRKDFQLLESGTVSYGPETLQFTYVFWWYGERWEDTRILGYAFRDDTLWLDAAVYYRLIES